MPTKVRILIKNCFVLNLNYNFRHLFTISSDNYLTMLTDDILFYHILLLIPLLFLTFRSRYGFYAMIGLAVLTMISMPNSVSNYSDDFFIKVASFFYFFIGIWGTLKWSNILTYTNTTLKNINYSPISKWGLSAAVTLLLIGSVGIIDYPDKNSGHSIAYLLSNVYLASIFAASIVGFGLFIFKNINGWLFNIVCIILLLIDVIYEMARNHYLNFPLSIIISIAYIIPSIMGLKSWINQYHKTQQKHV